MLIIGGSNSRMMAGYTATLTQRLVSAGYRADSINNISVGANTCLIGLQNLHANKELGDHNQIIIEYSVNDYGMFATGEIELWRAAFEGLVRSALRRWPSAHILVVMLGRGDAVPDIWATQVAEMYRIVDGYEAVSAINFAEHFAMNPPPNHYGNDLLHYSLETQSIVGNIIADVLLAGSTERAIALPEPVNAPVFDPVEIIDFPVLRPSRSTKFANSAVAVTAMKLLPGEAYEFEASGPLIALSFVSADDCGSFIVESGAKEALVHTLHHGVRDKKFQFLPLSAYGDWWKDQPGKRSIRITPCVDKRMADWPIFHVGPQNQESCVYLLTALVRAI